MSQGRRRRCALCGSTVHPALTFAELGHVFRDAVDQLFVQADGYHGDPAGYLLQDHFEVFHDRADPDRLIEVVEQILLSGVRVSKDLLDMPDYRGTFRLAEREWEADLSERVIRWAGGNRGEVRSGGASLDPFWVALEDMREMLPAGTILHRARLHEDRRRTSRFGIQDLGAPPAAETPAGRANRQGAPVLYTASDQATAIREVRPWIGCAVAVAEIQLQRDIMIVDATPRQIVTSPFFEELLDWKVNLPELIYTFAEELSRPVGPGESHRYESTQRMCEIVASGGYVGVRYPSALGPGSNVVLFDPAGGTAVSVQYVRPQSMDLEYEEIEEGNDLYDDSPFEELFELPGDPHTVGGERS